MMRRGLQYFLIFFLAYCALGFQEAAAQVPIVAKIDPASAIQGQQNVQVTIRGKNLLAATSVDINPSSGVTAGSLTNVTNTQLTVPLTINADAVPGERSLTVKIGNVASNVISFRIKI